MPQAIELSLRSQPKGGEPQFPDQDLAKLGCATRLLLLIHGYNNPRDDAIQAYDGFEKLQRNLAELPEGGDYAPGMRVVRVFWPGDADWGIASFLFFMKAIDYAQKSGQLLAKALEQHAGGAPLWVDVVAHSLGCRVTCEFLAALSENSAIRVERVAFFAGAVATFSMEPDDTHGFDTALNKHLSDGMLSLYSGSDMVLSFAFPAGSSLATGPEGVLPTALGHAFWTSSHVPLSVSQAENRGAGHSDYWGWKEDTAQQQGMFANSMARNFLRFQSSAPRTTTSVDAPIRSAAEARTIADREIQPREMTSRLAFGN